MKRTALILTLAMTPLTACAASEPVSTPMSGSYAPLGLTPSQSAARAVTPGDYRIGPLDKLNITVFRMEDLTIKEGQVDASGNIALPLVGTVVAGGRTTTELAEEIATRLRSGYLQSPQVSVIVAESMSQKVTVDGAVIEPGVFQLRGRTTLMQAVAMAKGPGRNANLRRVAVFRVIDGQRNAAVFDLAQIREGKAEDPEIIGSDVIVIDDSKFKGVMREVIGVLPAIAMFRPY